MTVPVKKIQTPELYNDGVRRIFYNGQMTEVEKPVLIDMSSLFDNFVTIILNYRVEPRSVIGFEVMINKDAHSVVAKVVSVRQMAMGFETRVLIDLIPEELIREIEELLSQQALIPDVNFREM